MTYRRIARIADIKVLDNRQRSYHDINAHQELVESIRANGLLHAPVLRTTAQDPLVLVAGERRLRAIGDLEMLGEGIRYDGHQFLPGEVPYSLVGDLTTLQVEEAELEENIRRLDLTWQERCDAVSRLANLRTRQAASEGRPAPSVADISKEVRGSGEGFHQDATRQEILLAKHLDNPAIAKAKSAAEAFKILKREEQAQKHGELARAVGKSLAGASHRIELGKAEELLVGLADGTYDVILTDPPYGMGADEFGDSGGIAAGAHFYRDDKESWQKLVREFAVHSWRVSKPDAALYCFCDIERFPELKDTLASVGWNCFRTPLIWYKPNGSRAPWPDAGPQRKYETILFAKKGGKKVNHLRGDVLEHPADPNLGHPAQKPVGLFEDLLRRSAAPGDRVLDPFAGTGPILVAAHNLKMLATAFEQDETAYGIMVSRLKDLK